MSAALDALEIECEYIVRIELEGSSVGLVVGPRMGVEEYGKAGEALIETLAASAAARLRRLELVDRLRAEVVEKQGIIQSKDQLIASVSHELRTPMTSVLGFADLLQGDAGDLTEEERLEMLQAIVDHSLDITNIVDDLLTVARSDTGSLIVRRQPVDLLDEAQVVVESRAIREVASIVVAGTSTLAIADPDRVRQVLRNLVVNAQRYGGGSVRVEVAKDVAAGYVRVIDNGPGVDVEQVEGIFEPYVRTQESLSQPASVGLGLTISRRLARLMGGDVTYRRAGGETTFELSVPVAAHTEVAA
jgi:signal transduction histidine kinase